MSAIPDKIEYRDCSPEKANDFVSAIEQKGVASRVSFAPASDKSHFDRYGFDCDGKRLGVVYDRKAKILSVTAPDTVSEKLKKLYSSLQKATSALSLRGAKRRGNLPEGKTDAASATPAPKPSAKSTPTDGKGAVGAFLVRPQTPKSTATETAPAVSLRGAKRRGNLPEGKTDTAPATPITKPTAVKPSVGADALVRPQTPKSTATDAAPATPIPKPAPKSNPAGKATVGADALVRPQTPRNGTSPQPPAEADAQGGNLSFKKFTEERFGDVVSKLKKRKQFKVASPSVQDKGKQTETITIAVSDGNQKLKLRFMPKKQVLQVQGKQETLFSEVRLVVSEESDFKSAVTAHAESADKKASEFNRQLKKLMPTAVGYMSEQVKLDFTIGVIEILDSTAEHYDYSMLLLPPFRGLERLIFDIQRAQNIVVKMIGQAYEKENNEYVLKASYRRRINSVVYPEVLGALYREYFATRNFYAHSDAIGGENRVISTRKQAVEVFTHMCGVVEYNCRKLDEIGFSIDKSPSEPKAPAAKKPTKKGNK